MIFYMYSIYDPEVESFDTRVNLGPLDPKEMAEQYRRAYIKMKPEDKAFMEGKKAVFLGEFDDLTGKISQAKLLEIFLFKEKEESQVEEESKEKEDA